VGDSYKFLASPYREFEQLFGGKTVLAGLRLKGHLKFEMGCPALGVSVAFLKQPALLGKAPQTKKILKIF
jgi:hypothetical protein